MGRGTGWSILSHPVRLAVLHSGAEHFGHHHHGGLRREHQVKRVQKVCGIERINKRINSTNSPEAGGTTCARIEGS